MGEILEALNNIFRDYRTNCNNLERLVSPDRLRIQHVLQAQQRFQNLAQLLDDLSGRLLEFHEGLPTNDEGEIIYPVNGEEGFAYNPDRSDPALDRIREVLETARKALVKFKHEQEPVDAAHIKAAAICDFLKGDEVEK